MPVTLTDEQMAAVKVQMEGGKPFRDALSAAGVEIASGQARRQLVAKYGQEDFRAAVTLSRPIPTFEKLVGMIQKMEPRLTDLAKVNEMISNLASAVVELDRIKDNISS